MELIFNKDYQARATKTMYYIPEVYMVLEYLNSA